MKQTKPEKNPRERFTAHYPDYRNYIGAAIDLVKELPDGFPAYCIYIPTGMNRDFEIIVLARLKAWGKTMGNNLLVADWDIGDESYRELASRLGIKNLPSIVLTDSHDPRGNDFQIVIDDSSVVRDVDTLIEILPNLVNHILTGQSNDVKEALKDAIKKRQGSKIRSLLKPISTGLSKVKTVKFSFGGTGFEVDRL
jgi:hypothetical protein